MLIGRFGKMSLQMGVEGNDESVQDFVLIHSGMAAAELEMCIHAFSVDGVFFTSHERIETVFDF